MKKILSIIGSISLVGTSTTSLVACNKNNLDDEISIIKEKENKFYIKNFNSNYEYNIRFELYGNNKYFFHNEIIPINYIGSTYTYREQSDRGQIYPITINFFQDNNSKKWYITGSDNSLILNNILLVKVGK